MVEVHSTRFESLSLPFISPPHRPLARIIMCDEPAFRPLLARRAGQSDHRRVAPISHRIELQWRRGWVGGEGRGGIPHQRRSEMLFLESKICPGCEVLLRVQLNSIRRCATLDWVYSELGNTGIGLRSAR